MQKGLKLEKIMRFRILAARKSVYRLAHQQHPERWSKQLRNWNYIVEVFLNLEKRRHDVILLQQATTTLKNAVIR